MCIVVYACCNFGRDLFCKDTMIHTHDPHHFSGPTLRPYEYLNDLYYYYKLYTHTDE